MELKEALNKLKEHNNWAEFHWQDEMAEVLIPVVETALKEHEKE